MRTSESMVPRSRPCSFAIRITSLEPGCCKIRAFVRLVVEKIYRPILTANVEFAKNLSMTIFKPTIIKSNIAKLIVIVR